MHVQQYLTPRSVVISIVLVDRSEEDEPESRGVGDAQRNHSRKVVSTIGLHEAVIIDRH